MSIDQLLRVFVYLPRPLHPNATSTVETPLQLSVCTPPCIRAGPEELLEVGYHIVNT
jgi:hypothetical protein